MKMEHLISNKNKKLYTSNFIRIGDLSYFEGPILSLFEEIKSGHLYLFDWVDRDEKFNRWIIYRVTPKHLKKFLSCKISHLVLFENRPDKTVYFTDIDSISESFSYYDCFEVENLPKDYYPNEDNFFDLSDCISYEKINSVISSSLSRQKSENSYFSVESSTNISTDEENKLKKFYLNQIQIEPIPYSTDLFNTLKYEKVEESNIYNTDNQIFDFENFSIANINEGYNLKNQSIQSFFGTKSKKKKNYANQYG